MLENHTSHRRIAISGVRSTSHALYISSWLRQFTFPECPVSFLDAETMARHVPQSKVLGVLERDSVPLEARKSFDTYLSVGAPSAKQTVKLFRMGRKPFIVSTDEGLGTYGSWLSRRSALRREGAGATAATIKSLARGTTTRLADQRWRLYQQGSHWSVNPDVAVEFQSRVSKSPGDGQTCMYLSQPWVELGLANESSVYDHLAKVRDASNHAGYELVVRLHPRQNAIEVPGVKMVQGGGLAELDPRVVNAGYLLGATSTALLNIAAIFKTPSIRVALPGGEDVKTLSHTQRSLLNHFLPEPIPTSRLEEALARGSR